MNYREYQIYSSQKKFNGCFTGRAGRALLILMAIAKIYYGHCENILTLSL
jgi:hypothetical protein